MRGGTRRWLLIAAALVVTLAGHGYGDDAAARRAEDAATRAEAAAARSEAAAARTEQAIERLERMLDEATRREDARRPPARHR